MFAYKAFAYRQFLYVYLLIGEKLLNLNEKQEKLNKQLPKNLISNFAYFILNILVGILLVPYFIDNLGVAGYAIIPLATSLTNYVGLVVQSLNSSVSRYLTIDIQRSDYEKANETFNTALFGTLLIFFQFPLIKSRIQSYCLLV
jgi:membrane protein EpsK